MKPAAVPDALQALLPADGVREHLSLRVEKSAYRLTLLYAQAPLKIYPVVFGFAPVADKCREGDGATPEGRFQLRNLFPHPRWSKFLWVDYPTADSWRKHQAAKQRGDIPADATIGGEIGIHGVPVGEDDWISQQHNWTAGCVALTRGDIDELYAVAFKGMGVDILP